MQFKEQTYILIYSYPNHRQIFKKAPFQTALWNKDILEIGGQTCPLLLLTCYNVLTLTIPLTVHM